MKLDCYAVLGLSPAAEDVVIRAAYLALMRAYHPDRNGSAEAAARARAITEAYKTLGDPARRAEYDAGRWEHNFDIRGYDEEAEPRLPRRDFSIRMPKLPAVQWPKLPTLQWPRLPAVQWSKAPVIGSLAVASLAIVLAMSVLPMSQRADRIPSPKGQTAIAKPEAVPEPETRPPTAIASSEPTKTNPPPLPAAVTPSDEGSVTQPEPVQAKPKELLAAKAEAPTPKRVAEKTSPPPAAPPTVKLAAVDEKARVATLEGMSTSFYNQSVSHADDARRAQLQQARDLFVNVRNACRSDACVGDAHANYIRDISRIMKKN